MEKENIFDTITQFAIPITTIGSQVIVSLKLPEWGFLLLLVSQPFWLYSSWKAYKKAGQAGLLVNTAIMTVVIIFGVINYWFL